MYSSEDIRFFFAFSTRMRLSLMENLSCFFQKSKDPKVSLSQLVLNSKGYVLNRVLTLLLCKSIN